MKRRSISPVVLAAWACVAVCVASGILLYATPGDGPSRFVASRWLPLLAVELACVIPLFFLQRQVRRAKWLWLLWLITALDYSFPIAAFLWRSAYSLVVVSFAITWGVKAVVAIMLFLPGGEAGSSALGKRPNKAPEPTPTAVTLRAVEVNFEMKTRNCDRDEARVVPAAVVAHL